MFLTNNPLPNGFPWSTRTTSNTNAYTDSPTTGIVRNYDWTISRGMLAPDGYQRSMLLVNGAFPGPAIEANCEYFFLFQLLVYLLLLFLRPILTSLVPRGRHNYGQSHE